MHYTNNIVAITTVSQLFSSEKFRTSKIVTLPEDGGRVDLLFMHETTNATKFCEKRNKMSRKTQHNSETNETQFCTKLEAQLQRVHDKFFKISTATLVILLRYAKCDQWKTPGLFYSRGKN